MRAHSSNQLIDKSGVCVKGSYLRDFDHDCYGVLEELLSWNIPV